MAAVELACVVPIFFTLIFAQFEVARMGMVSQMMTIAAREGARTAVLSTTTTQATVVNKMNAVLANTGIPLGTYTITPSNWATSANGTSITVKLSLPYNQVSWFPVPKFFADSILRTEATMSSERP